MFDMCINYGNKFDWKRREIEEEVPVRRFHPLYYRFNRFIPRRRLNMWW